MLKTKIKKLLALTLVSSFMILLTSAFAANNSPFTIYTSTGKFLAYADSFATAVSKVPSDATCTITLNKNYKNTSSVTFPAGKNITLDCDTYQLTSTKPITIAEGGNLILTSMAQDQGPCGGIYGNISTPLVTNNGTLNMSYGCISNKGTKTSAYALRNNNTLLLSYSWVKGRGSESYALYNKGTAQMSYSKVISSNASAAYLASGSTTTINSGLLEGNTYGVKTASNSKLILNNGRISGIKKNAVVNNGTMTMKGGIVYSYESTGCSALSNKATLKMYKGTVTSNHNSGITNYDGKTYIYGGTIQGLGYHGISNLGTGDVTVKVKDAASATISIKGAQYALRNAKTGEITFTSGTLLGKKNPPCYKVTFSSSKPKVTKTSDGYYKMSV